MQNERQRILELVEKGTISAQEAITLLKALEQSGKSTQNVMDDVSKESQSFSTDKESLFEEKSKDGDKKKEDFMKHFQDEMQDFRKDLTQIGSLLWI